MTAFAFVSGGFGHAATNVSSLSGTFDLTNREGTVFKEVKIQRIGEDHVLLSSAAGTNKIFFTNLPAGVQAELAGLAAAQRLNSPDRAARSNRRGFYQKLLTDLEGKSDEDKVKSFSVIVQTCVAEMKKLNAEMAETEKAGKDAIAAEEIKMQNAEKAAAAARDSQTAQAEADFSAGKFTADQRDERLLEIKTKYLADREQTQKNFAAAKVRLWQTVIDLGKDQKADYDAVVNVLKRLQVEQEALGKRLEQK
ncbi:MAG TPA: hypothetical protein VMZ27_06850 [Candidatus Saccharimonadales bacterium]|nr:hypothetical protein [Candidatus Saccharimonadales bacterium]